MSKNVIFVIVVVVVIGAVVYGGNLLYKNYSNNDKNVICIVDMDVILERKHKQLIEGISNGKIQDQQEAIEQLETYKKRVKAVILEVSKKHKVAIFDKRIVVSYNQKDVTNIILERLEK